MTVVKTELDIKMDKLLNDYLLQNKIFINRKNYIVMMCNKCNRMKYTYILSLIIDYFDEDSICISVDEIKNDALQKKIYDSQYKYNLKINDFVYKENVDYTVYYDRKRKENRTIIHPKMLEDCLIQLNEARYTYYYYMVEMYAFQYYYNYLVGLKDIYKKEINNVRKEIEKQFKIYCKKNYSHQINV